MITDRALKKIKVLVFDVDGVEKRPAIAGQKLKTSPAGAGHIYE